MVLEVDKNRAEYFGITGVYIRAKVNDKWGNYDVAQLTKESFLHLIRDRNWAEEMLLILLDYPRNNQETNQSED